MEFLEAFYDGNVYGSTYAYCKGNGQEYFPT
jgi:hypothetical protein